MSDYPLLENHYGDLLFFQEAFIFHLDLDGRYDLKYNIKTSENTPMRSSH